MTAHWNIERTDNERFPYRISIEQDGRVTLALRAQARWPGPGGQVFCLREKADAEAVDGELLERVPIASLKRMGRKLSLVLDRSRNKRCDFLFLTKAYKDRPGEYEQIFFRTQGALREHKSRGRSQLFGDADLEVVVDSAERYPWRFKGAEVRREALPVGDYALVQDEGLVAVVERKSFKNVLRDIAHLQVLHQQLNELGSYPHAALVVEAQYGDFLQPDKVGRWSVSHLARVLAELSAMHPAVPVIYAGNRKMANEWAHGFFDAVARRLQDRAPDHVAEVAAPYQLPSSGGFDRAVRHAVIHELPGRFSMRLLRSRFPEMPAERLRRILTRLREEGKITSEGRGRGTVWVRDRSGE